MESLLGKKVKITKCINYHGFEIGEIVEIRNFTDNWYYTAVSKNGRTFGVTDEEFEPIEDTPIELPTTISRRDYFAAAALQGLMSNTEESNASSKTVLYVLGLSSDTNYDFMEHHPMYIAKLSVMYADELIKQLDK